jgi:uncharacterized protein (DUF934 family)
MAKLIRNRRVADDSWLWLKPDAAGALPCVPDEGDVIVPLALWLERREALLARKGRTGVWLDSREGPEAIVSNLSLLPLVAVNFPAFADGRGFSTARLLRERYGYPGELRAVGDVLRDHVLYMERCGFDSFALREDQDIAEVLAAFNELPESYQASAVQPLPLFRRRLGQSS